MACSAVTVFMDSPPHVGPLSTTNTAPSDGSTPPLRATRPLGHVTLSVPRASGPTSPVARVTVNDPIPLTACGAWLGAAVRRCGVTAVQSSEASRSDPMVVRLRIVHCPFDGEAVNR